MKKIFFKKGILIAFGELFLKSERVKKIFENQLIKNLNFFLKKKGSDFRIFRFRERIFIETEKTKKFLSQVKKIFGISWIAEALFFEKFNLKKIADFVFKNYKNWLEKNETFAIRVKKGPEIKEGSKEIIERIAKKIERKVDLKKPKKEIFVEARKDGYFLYFKKIKGAGGLPISTGGKVLSLISGGIDSPVAAFLMAKRGAQNLWVHFHSFPLVSKRSIEKIRKLKEIFLKFQPHLKIYFLPFFKIQMKIKSFALPKYRVLLYRRAMFKIAQKIAKKENCLALVTGESLGQVSSQTLPNLQIISEAVKIPILRPLIGTSKEEIIKIAKKIGSFEISILPQEDCCQLFVPKHASAQGNLEKIKNLEKKLKIDKIINQALKEAKVEIF